MATFWFSKIPKSPPSNSHKIHQHYQSYNHRWAVASQLPATHTRSRVSGSRATWKTDESPSYGRVSPLIAFVQRAAARRIHQGLAAASFAKDGSRVAQSTLLGHAAPVPISEQRSASSPPYLHTRGPFLRWGSRGNPGTGGSGAVLIRADRLGPSAEILWAGSASLAAKTITNNRAEYIGLIWGLQAAKDHALGRIYVVGDSAMILTQIQTYKNPKCKALQPLHARARLLADTIRVREWTHHYRAHNKMADLLANQAMDCATSAQGLFPSLHPQLAEVAQHLDNEIAFWQQDHHD